MLARLCTVCVLSVTVLSLSACHTTSARYAAGACPYAVTRGAIVQVEGMHSDQHTMLSDGVAITVSEPGCRVTMQLGDGMATVDVKPGGILVYGGQNDYLLQPYRTHAAPGGGTQAAEPGADLTATAP